jgi:hypothetical protein
MRARKDKYNDNKSDAWVLIYGQCTPKLKNKFKGTSEYEAPMKGNNVVQLLIMIEGCCC